MRAQGTYLSRQLGQLTVLLGVDQYELDERIRLPKNGSKRFLDLLAPAVHRHKDADDAVSARSATGNETVPAGESKPGFQKNQERRKRGKPADEKKGELEPGAHTSLLIYL